MRRLLFLSLLLVPLAFVLPATASPAPSASEATTVDSVQVIASLLQANGGDSAMALRVARAVHREAVRNKLDPLLLVGIIGVENAELHVRSTSTKGARGIMQVMPHWKADIKGCGQNLHDIDTNICFGARILRINLEQTGSLRQALLRYNGCRSNPDCRMYPTFVFSRAGRAVLLARQDS